jgi:O-antigen ligase
VGPAGRRGSTLGLVVGAALASVVLGALCARSLPLAAGCMVAIAVCTVIAISPSLWLALSLSSLAAAPELIGLVSGTPLAHPEVWKGLLYAGVAPIIWHRGVRWQYALPFFAYGAATLLSAIGGTHPDSLTLVQTLSSLMTLLSGWIFVIVAWDWDRDQKYLKLIAAIPVMCVLLGLALEPFGWTVLQPYVNPPRLQGAEIAALLGGAGAASTAAAIILWRRSQWRPAIPLGVAAALCCLGSLGRGAMIMLVIVTAPAAYRALRTLLRRKGGETYLTLLAVALGTLAAVVLIVVPALITRGDSVSYNAATHTVTKDATSGRLEAWPQFYKEAKVNLLFGRGMGSGPIIKIGQVGFKAQHNEYLRLLLELGYFGGLLVLASMIVVLRRVIRAVPRKIRPDAIALAVSLAVYSATDNVLTSRHLAVPILATLAIAAAPSRHDAAGDEEAEETAPAADPPARARAVSHAMSA